LCRLIIRSNGKKHVSGTFDEEFLRSCRADAHILETLLCELNALNGVVGSLQENLKAQHVNQTELKSKLSRSEESEHDILCAEILAQNAEFTEESECALRASELEETVALANTELRSVVSDPHSFPLPRYCNMFPKQQCSKSFVVPHPVPAQDPPDLGDDDSSGEEDILLALPQNGNEFLEQWCHKSFVIPHPLSAQHPPDLGKDESSGEEYFPSSLSQQDNVFRKQVSHKSFVVPRLPCAQGPPELDGHDESSVGEKDFPYPLPQQDKLLQKQR